MYSKDDFVAGDLLTVEWDDTDPQTSIFVDVDNVDDDDLVISMRVLTLHGIEHVEISQVQRHKSGNNVFAIG